MRRLWGDINLKVDYSYYQIRDYVANNWKYAQYPMWGPGATQTPPGLEGSDMYVNLDEVRYQGVEVELNGHIMDSLYGYFSYSFRDLSSKGSEPAGKELGDIAKHRVNAGLRYEPFKNTRFLLDYKFQDRQIAHTYDEEPPGSGNYIAYDNPMGSYDVFDFAVEQTLFKKRGFIKDAVLKFYVNNLFDEEYENSRGYPMTDRTYGGQVSFAF